VQASTASLVDPPRPPGFRSVAFERSWVLPRPRPVVWGWLNDPRTFTRGQLPPFRVEFLETDGRTGFEPGVLNAHHGPLMSFHGVIGEVRAPEYRDLRYSYGSYALSMRLVRPTRLRFWFEEAGEGCCQVRMRLDAHVRGWFSPFWRAANAFFWWNFGLSARLLLALRRGKGETG